MSGGDWKDMLYAVQNGQIQIVKYHIKNGVNPNFEHPELFTTALLESVLHDRIDIAKYLLENGADPNLKSGFNNESPLSIARKKNNVELVKLIRSYSPKSNYSIFGEIIMRLKLLIYK